MKDKAEFSLSEFISRTGNLLIHLLNTCNLECRHCYLGASGSGRKALPPALVLRTLDEADAMGIKSVQLSGGEPLLYPGLEEVLDAAQDRNFQLSFSTNATLLDGHIADRLAAMGAFVVVSIDGPPEFHDDFRGRPGCFSQAEAGIGILVERDVETKMVTTISEQNYEWIDWCVEWAVDRGIDVLQFQPLERIGRGREMPSACLSDNRLLELFIHLNDLAAKCLSKGLRITMTYKRRAQLLEHPCQAYVCNGRNCHRGVEKELKKIVIREDGTILPELPDIDRRFMIGNLYEATLEENILSFLAERYVHFDQLCRNVYRDVVPNYTSPLVPWNETLSRRSYSFEWPGEEAAPAQRALQTVHG